MTEIITDLEKLRNPAEPLKFLTETGLDREEGDSILTELLAVMEKHHDVLALAAPQIGINKRIFCIRFNNMIKTFIDPIIIKKANYKIAPEVCVSMPGKEILISRPEELTVVYHTEQYKYEENKLLGAAARLFDQQCQLLDGILPYDLGLVSDVATDGSLADLNEGEINELVEIYKQYVSTKAEALNTKISENSELTDTYKKLKFSEKVVNGKAALVAEDGKQHKKAVHKAVLLTGKNHSDQMKNISKTNLKQFLNKKGK